MSEQQPLVLVVDDEENIRFLVESGLQLAGLDSVAVADGRAAIAAVAEHRPDLILLDVMMPELDGFEVLRRLRDAGDRTPVIFLTARDATDDRVAGLTSGADDYVVKPFAIAELVARVRLRLEDRGGARDLVLRCADLQLDPVAHRVTRYGETIDLSPTEYKLLHLLIGNVGRVLSRAQILDHVWEYDFDGDSSVVDTYISYLRRKLDHTPPKLIHTIRGVGFCLRADG
ncbi:MAG: response regulator transcription factor [Ilumatobacter sp.]|uniref:response regulator transcription factor n=1 Tax=Ilumatobacter sp. TaxID=1967498 RepID=UPI0026226BCC|nr:response regulator transcription factor [Ilumatobacter sp.]MDJ0767556.1 response regulator transcription factor [Ilumatobacter sp.]